MSKLGKQQGQRTSSFFKCTCIFTLGGRGGVRTNSEIYIQKMKSISAQHILFLEILFAKVFGSHFCL